MTLQDLKKSVVLATLFLSFSACTSERATQNSGSVIPCALTEKSLGIAELDLDAQELRFHGSFMGGEKEPLLASSPTDSMMYAISKSENGIKATPMCKIDRFERFMAYYFEDCSSLHLDNETGQFSYYKHAQVPMHWDFPAYTPQELPHRNMIFSKGVVYTLNSSKAHNVSEPAGASAYFSEVSPILSFRLDEPHGSVKVSGRFPLAYSKSDKSVPDYQPYFCMNGSDECVLSFQYCDSLYFVENDKIRAAACKSKFYTMPQFLSFEDAKSLSATRRFEAQSPMYLWTTYNPIREEYYRLFKHASENQEEVEFSVLVLDARMNQTAELTFELKDYSVTPLIANDMGFMLLNLKESSLKKKYCFESFGL